jgi:hypothetical protein
MTDLHTENARLREALKLAADRLLRCAVEYDAGTLRFIETGEWADEARIALAAPAPDAVQEAARVPEIAALIEAAKAATVVLAEHEPYPLPVLHNLLLKLDAVDVAILRAKEAGQ